MREIFFKIFGEHEATDLTKISMFSWHHILYLVIILGIIVALGIIFFKKRTFNKIKTFKYYCYYYSCKLSWRLLLTTI